MILKEPQPRQGTSGLAPPRPRKDFRSGRPDAACVSSVPRIESGGARDGSPAPAVSSGSSALRKVGSSTPSFDVPQDQHTSKSSPTCSPHFEQAHMGITSMD